MPPRITTPQPPIPSPRCGPPDTGITSGASGRGEAPGPSIGSGSSAGIPAPITGSGACGGGGAGPGVLRRPGRQSAVAPPPASLPPLPARVRERVLAQAGASRCAPAVAWVTVTVEPGAVQALLAAERTAAPARVHS